MKLSASSKTQFAGRHGRAAAAGALAFLSVAAVPTAGHAFNVSQVTGASAPTSSGNQAETNCSVSLVGGTRIESVVFNDDTGEVPAKISYTGPTGRIASPGFTGVGWSFRTRTGSTDGAWTHQNLTSPTALGWDFLWGDPSLATNPGLPSIVLFGTLAIPHDKFVFVSNLRGTPGTLQGPLTGDPSPLGGGCVGRSTDGGQTFSIVGCVRDTSLVSNPVTDPNNADSMGHFYDGSSVAVTGPSSGKFTGFAAFIDTETARQALWTMDDVTSNIANPFHIDSTVMGNTGRQPVGDNGTLGEIETHVRLRASGSDLWLMSADFNGIAAPNNPFGSWSFAPADLKVNIRGRNGNAVDIAPDAEVGMAVDFGSTVAGSELTMRTGPQFDFDIGVNESGAPEMRFVYLAAPTDGLGTSQGFFIQGGFCTPNLVCTRPTQWRTPVTNQPGALFPSIKFGAAPGSGAPNWKVTYQSVTGTQMAIFSADLYRPDLVPSSSPAFAQEGLAVAQQSASQTPCPDVRAANLGNAGYWGDYDGMTYDSTTGNFVRTFTDSSLGCNVRGPLTSTNVHVSAAEIGAFGAPRQATVTLSKISLATTGFNLGNCGSGSPTPRAINGEDSNGDVILTCVPTLNSDGSLSTTATTTSTDLGCGDSHSGFVDISCAGTGVVGDQSISGTVTMSLSDNCGQDDQHYAGTFTFTTLEPGTPQSTAPELEVCGVFSNICATGMPCSFNDFNADISVSNDPH